MAAKFLTQYQFARLNEVSPKTVCLWVQKGYAILAPDGRVDVDATNRRLRQRPRHFRGGTCKGPTMTGPSWD